MVLLFSYDLQLCRHDQAEFEQKPATSHQRRKEGTSPQRACLVDRPTKLSSLREGPWSRDSHVNDSCLYSTNKIICRRRICRPPASVAQRSIQLRSFLRDDEKWCAEVDICLPIMQRTRVSKHTNECFNANNKLCSRLGLPVTVSTSTVLMNQWRDLSRLTAFNQIIKTRGEASCQT